MADTTTKVPKTTGATIAGLFKDESKAERAVDELRVAGFSENQIGIATAHDEGKVGSFWDRLGAHLGKHEHTERAEDLEESLRDCGIPEQQAGYFNSELGRGGVLVTIHAGPERATKALSILQQNGADVGSASAEWRGTRQPGASGQRIQLLGEILRVHKERVSRGEVRLRKEVVTENQNIEVPTTREELVIERVPGQGREAAGSQVGSGEKEFRVPLSEERVHVEKKPVVNEEVRVGKREVQDTKRVTDQVRHEELRTEGDAEEDVQRAREKTRKSA
ncbi:MAG TPA: YsnF/AvaK domain-containing protein [Terriglobales bacterium]|nr:YsnF/AvaK domain-containing protein [Terriglobales bacterium]